jgi:DHA1 family tetracycline resistance protein-like MFS transporter
MPEARVCVPADRPRSTLPILFSVVVIDLIGFGIVLPVLPFYAESLGARTITGTSLALVLLGMAESLFWLFAARILGGIFGANISVATAYVTDVTDSQERTRWMGMIGASFGVGFVLGPAIGGLLGPFGYAVPMLAAAAMAAVNLVFAAFTLKEPASHRSEESAGIGRLEALRTKGVGKMCSANFLFSFAVSQLETVFAFFMMDRFDYDVMKVAGILVLMAVIMIAIQGGAIRSLAARYGERTLLVAGALLLAGAFATVPWMHRVALLLVPLSVSAIGRGVSQPSLLSMVSQQTSEATRGSIMGTFQASASLARVLGPLAAGFLYDRSMGSPFLLASGLMLGVMAIGAALPAGLAVKSEASEAPS